ncbi:MAG TPA: cobalt-precorrin-6A reductase [Kiloniellales bacterium]
MPGKRILILGGTGEARALAGRLIDAGQDVVTSLAGVTQAPHLPKGEVRRGGFGGPQGLAAYLRDGGFEILIDATHPFAAQISRHAAEAAKACGLPIYRLERPAWVAEEGDHWIGVPNIAAAVAALPADARVFLTIGRKEVAPFLARADLTGVMRMIEAPEKAPPPRWHLILARPPFTIAGERELMAANRITHVVSKNAGGEETRAKLIAARETKIPVVMIARPAKPAAIVMAGVDDAFQLLSP